MYRIIPGRQARFKAALALAGIKRHEWAAKAGVANSTLGMVLRQPTRNADLIEEVDAFVERVTKKALAGAA